MPYIKRTIQSGEMLEREVYFATRNGKKIARGANTDPTPADMARVNERNAQKKLQRLMCANFSRKNGDLFVTFTYEGPVTEAEALKGERNLLDRIKRLRKRKGLPELKYIAVTEKQSQWHIHLIMNGGITLEELKELWGTRGRRLHISTLDDSDGFTGLARYLTEGHKPKKNAQGEDAKKNVKQERRKGQRRWHASRNLKKPVIKREEIKRLPRRGEPKPPKGYRLIPDSWQYVESRFGIYTYAAFVKDGDAGGGAKCGLQKC